MRIATCLLSLLLVTGCANTVPGRSVVGSDPGTQTRASATARPPAPRSSTPAASTAPTTTAATTGGPVPSSPAPTTAPPPAAPGIGDTVTFSDDDGSGTITLNGIRRVGETEFGTPPENGSFLVVDITFAATSGIVSVSSIYLALQDAAGFTYSDEFGVVDNDLPSGDVVAGRQSRGELAYDVAEGPVVLDYATFEGTLATFRFTG